MLNIVKHIWKVIFSIKNTTNHKIIIFCGIKIKFKQRVRETNSNMLFNPYSYENRTGFEFFFDKSLCLHGFVDYGSVALRNMSTIKMFSIVMSRLKNKLSRNFKIVVQTGDLVRETNQEIWAYTRFKNIQPNVKLIPDFFFDCWKEIGCENFDQWTHKIVENSKKTPEFNKLFWSGALDLNVPARHKFYELAKKNDKLECQPITWQRDKWIPNHEILNDRKITLLEHPKYKYLIDLPCAGYSGRFKALLFTGRPVFKVEDNFEEFFYKDLKPFEHYIPVKNDLSDLEKQLNWAENNYEQALEIANNAQDYAIKNLNMEKCIEYIEKMILEIGG